MARGKIDLNSLSSEERAAIEARREYQRKWRETNRDKVKENNRRFWLKKAEEMRKTSETKK